MKSDKIPINSINSFVGWIEEEKYDSDAIADDFRDYQKGSNIIENGENNMKFTDFMKEYGHD